MIGSRRITLSFSINWLVCILIVAIVLIVLFIWFETWRPTLIFSAAVLGGAAGLLTAINALDSRRSSTEHAKKGVALEFMNRWNDPQFYHAKKNGREILKEMKQKTTVEQQKVHLEEDVSRLTNLFDVLNMFESLAVAIRSELADEETSKRFFRSLLLEYWHTTEGFIKARRAERQNTRLLQEMEWLFGRWKD